MNETEGMPGYVWWTYARRADAYVANSIHHTHTYFIFFLYVSCPFALLLLCHRKRRPTERSHKGQCASVSSFFSTWLCFIAAVKWDKKQHTKVFFYYFAFCARWTNINFFFVRVVVYVFFSCVPFYFQSCVCVFVHWMHETRCAFNMHSTEETDSQTNCTPKTKKKTKQRMNVSASQSTMFMKIKKSLAASRSVHSKVR